MQEYWFSSRILGFGFGLPITWQGWVALIGLFLVLGLTMYHNDLFTKPLRKDWRYLISFKGIRFLIELFVVLVLFTLLFGDKVEGGLVWHWLD